jgi:hypothetical protein
MADITGNFGNFGTPKPSKAVTNATQNSFQRNNSQFQQIPATQPAAEIPTLNKEITVGGKFAEPKPKDPIETLILFFTKNTATLQIGVYKILYGTLTDPPLKKVTIDPITGKYIISNNNPANKTLPQKVTDFFQSGLFNILDTINGLDLCNILTFLTTTTNSKPKKRPEKPWSATQTALFNTQDKAKEAQDLIDKYLALPTTLVRSYAGIQPQAVTPQQAVTASGAPEGTDTIVGTNAQKYNVYSLLQALKDTFTAGGQNSIITKEDATLLSQVPGFGGSLNFIDDFIGLANQYTDYRNINNEDLQKLLKKINDVRSICVTIQTLDFKSILALAGNFLGVDIRAQIQKLSKVVDPVKLLPTIKQIADQTRSFTKTAQRTFNILTQLQFIVKLSIILTKIFVFIEVFFLSLVLPSLFTTSGIQSSFSKARELATNGKNQVIRRLEQVNGLLSVLISFIRFLLATSTELLRKLDVLIAQLEACDATRDSAVLLDLKASYKDLKQIQEQLGTYITLYDGKTSPDTATFGKYSIRVVDEELTEKSITNKRRRGIAVDQNGNIVTQSDLTFATNTSIIIEETKVKLISLKLVAPQFSTFANSDLAVITTSIDYLEDDTSINPEINLNDILQDNPDLPDSIDSNTGTGLNAFINNLSGGKKLRTRTKTIMQEAGTKLKNQVNQSKIDGNNALSAPNVATSVGKESGNQNNTTPQNSNPGGVRLR